MENVIEFKNLILTFSMVKIVGKTTMPAARRKKVDATHISKRLQSISRDQTANPRLELGEFPPLAITWVVFRSIYISQRIIDKCINCTHFYLKMTYFNLCTISLLK